MSPRAELELQLLAERTSEWADPHILEAVLEEAVDDAIAFDLSTFGADLTDAPDVCTPYGRGFGAVDMRMHR